MNAVVLAGGTLPLPHLWREALTPGALVVAADGGLAHARVLGLSPDLLVGDLDSALERDLERFAGVPTLRYPTAKDELDLELAVAAALARGATAITVVGAFGGRLDQSFAALLVAAAHARAGRRIALFGGPHEGHVACPDNGAGAVRRDLAAGTTVSLLALTDDCRVTTTGVAYPLTASDLAFGVGKGVSNAALGGPVTLTAHRGTVALLVEHLPPTTREAA